MRKKSKKKLFKGIKSALKGIAFSSLLLLLIVRTYEALSWKDTLGDYISSVDQLYATEDNMMDVVFMGSSHTYCSISPALLWGENGIAAFNMTTSGQDKNSTCHYLRELLKTQSPEVVFVEMYGLAFDVHAVEGNVHRNMMGMPLSENSIALIDDYVIDEEMNLNYKLRWPIVHTRYKELEMYDFVTYDFSEYGRGVDFNYVVTPNVYPMEAQAYTEVELTDTNRAWLDELYSLSQENNFELVFFVAPAGVTVEQQGQINAASLYAKELGVDFIDFNQFSIEMGIDYLKDFIDNQHLNGYGAEKLTRYFADYMDDNYDLKDHRNEEGYEQWDKSYARFLQVKETHKLKQCGSFDTFILQLKEMENITCVVSFEGGYLKNIPSQPIATMLDMSDEDYQIGGTFLYENGKLTRIMDNESTEVYIKELNEHDTLKIQNMNLKSNPGSNTEDIMINMEPLGVCTDGVNFVVYDNITKQVIDTRGFY